jgi:hypothetical protein
MVWNPASDNFNMYSGLVAEAPEFIGESQASDVIKFFDKQDTSCALHPHTHHTPNNEDVSDNFSWDKECINLQGSPSSEIDKSKLDNIFGISGLIKQMQDAVARSTNEDVELAKVVFHKYTPNSSGPEHIDVWPQASLLYLNDDYEGGELYFPNQDLEISPKGRSLLIFNGGGDNMHGVKRISSGYRYVLVAFWEFRDKANLQNFWDKENKEVDENNAVVSKEVSRLRSYNESSTVLYAHRFPIFEIQSFVSSTEAERLEDYLSINDSRDECWGPICFREYWEAIGGSSDKWPQLVPGIEKDTISKLSKKIKDAVEFFLDGEQVEFSKMKGHEHPEGASSPPHGHGPARAVAILALNDSYEGGEVTIPMYGISLKLDLGSLYIFREGDDVPNGVAKVISGTRHIIMSHWQPVGHPYNSAGASERNFLV